MCYAGMGEYIYPINSREGDTLAFISVSGYRIEPNEASKRMTRVAQKYNLPVEELLDTYHKNVTHTLPDQRDLDTKIMPLCRMFELLNLLVSDLNHDGIANVTRSSLLSLAVVYLRRNYARPVTVDQVARVCHCSSSTLSHIFKKELGVSIREYVRSLRISEAVQMLKNTDLPISTISDMLGYCTPNYFCQVFIREKGQSPSRFRQECKKRQ